MTDRYAVIGNPIGHSKSPLIHRGFAAVTGQDIDYSAIEGPMGGFAGAVDMFRRDGGLGLNITAPFKLDAFAYATELCPRARQAGAANAMKFEGDRVIADNFDGVGLIRDIVHNLDCPMAGRRILLLGAGGAVRGALLPFLDQAPAQIVIANRVLDKAQALAAGDSRVSAVSYDGLAGQGVFDVVVNGTSASLQGQLPPVPAANFAPGAVAYDMVYGRGLTPFLRLAQQAGVRRVADGVGMLVEQAADAFAWWRGIRPQTAPMIETLTVPLI